MHQFEPCDVIGEVLGVPAAQMQDPAKADYQCPFINGRCIKRGQKSSGPFPVCSVFKRAKLGGKPDCGDLIAVCPKRFMQTRFIKDSIEHCWTGPKPKHWEVAYEVKMAEYGTVDCVIADLSKNREQVLSFLSIELQAIDITGSYQPAYEALLKKKKLDKRPGYNFNWRNVSKRYITQLIHKGFFHHQWKTQIISVIQDHVYDRIHEHLNFESISVAQADVVFMIYRFNTRKTSEGGGYDLVLDRIVGTSHSSLMMRILYRSVPSKDEFCTRILKRLQD